MSSYPYLNMQQGTPGPQQTGYSPQSYSPMGWNAGLWQGSSNQRQPDNYTNMWGIPMGGYGGWGQGASGQSMGWGGQQSQGQGQQGPVGSGYGAPSYMGYQTGWGTTPQDINGVLGSIQSSYDPNNMLYNQAASNKFTRSSDAAIPKAASSGGSGGGGGGGGGGSKPASSGGGSSMPLQTGNQLAQKAGTNLLTGGIKASGAKASDFPTKVGGAGAPDLFGTSTDIQKGAKTFATPGGTTVWNPNGVSFFIPQGK